MVNIASPEQRFSRSYHVSIDEDGNPTDCTCPDRYYRGGICKHMAEVANIESSRRQEQSQHRQQSQESTDMTPLKQRLMRKIKALQFAARNSKINPLHRYALSTFSVPAKEIIAARDSPENYLWSTNNKNYGKDIPETSRSRVDTASPRIPVRGSEVLGPHLSGTKLAVALKEIKSRFGVKSPRLNYLVDRALKGYTKLKDTGEDVFTHLGNELKRVAALGVGDHGLADLDLQHRARELSTAFNWHRITRNLTIDREVKKILNASASDRLKERGEVHRNAHNRYGWGATERGKVDHREIRDFRNRFLTLLNGSGKTPGSLKPFIGAGVTERELLNSMRRLGEHEEMMIGRPAKVNTDVPYLTYGSHGTLGISTKKPTERLTTELPRGGPAHTVTKTGLRVRPQASAMAYRRKLKLQRIRRNLYKYAGIRQKLGEVANTAGRLAGNALGSVGRKVGFLEPNPRPVVGVRYKSLVNGIHNDATHEMALAELGAIKNAIPPVVDDPIRLHENVIDAATKMRNFIGANPNHPAVKTYLAVANHLPGYYSRGDLSRGLSPTHPISELTAPALLLHKAATREVPREVTPPQEEEPEERFSYTSSPPPSEVEDLGAHYLSDEGEPEEPHYSEEFETPHAGSEEEPLNLPDTESDSDFSLHNPEEEALAGSSPEETPLPLASSTLPEAPEEKLPGDITLPPAKARSKATVRLNQKLKQDIQLTIAEHKIANNGHINPEILKKELQDKYGLTPYQLMKVLSDQRRQEANPDPNPAPWLAQSPPSIPPRDNPGTGTFYAYKRSKTFQRLRRGLK